MMAENLTIGLIAAALAIALWPALRRASARPVIVELAGLKWTRKDFCRRWLITGDTASGKSIDAVLNGPHPADECRRRRGFGPADSLKMMIGGPKTLTQPRARVPSTDAAAFLDCRPHHNDAV